MSDPVTRLNAALEGRYRIERQLGEGGMATVYLARDLKHSRNVALKVLKPDLAAVVGAERFLAEIETTANLQHPHILPLFDSGEADSFLFYVMPYVEGESLRERLDREHQLPVDEAVAIATKVAGALQAAHERGVIHRDIKPANILLSKGEPLISDFGIALAVRAGGAGRLTETGLSLGTPHYMSPEQATGDVSVGAATDVYALGCVLYEMLVGEPPYTGSTPQAILGKIIQAEPVSATKARRTVPAHVDAAIRRALEKVAADRFASSSAFARALGDTAFRHRDLVGAAGGVAGTASAGPWNRVAVAMTCLAAVATLVAAGVMLRPEAPAPVTRQVLSLDGWAAVAGPPFGEYAALAPDGSSMVLPLEDRLGIKYRESSEIVPIPGTEGGRNPVYSPDGEWIAYAVGEEVFKLALVGGAPIRLAEGAEPAPNRVAMAWLDDGTLLYEDVDRRFLQMPENGGEPLRIVQGDPTVWMHGLPGGRGALVVGNSLQLWVLDLDAGTIEEILTGVIRAWYAPTGHVVYVREDGAVFAQPFDLDALELSGGAVPLFEGVQVTETRADMRLAADGTLLYLEGRIDSGDPVSQLVVVDLDGSQQALSLSPRPLRNPAWSPDGESVAFQSRGHIYTYNTVLNTAPRQITFEGANGNPVFSPDGTRLAFWRTTPTLDLFVKQLADDSPARPLTSLDGREIPWQWPNDTLIAFLHRPRVGGINYDLWTLDLSDPDAPEERPYLTSEADLVSIAISPDGTLAAYASNETGTYEVYVRSFPDPGERTVVSHGGGFVVGWSPDGGTLYYDARVSGPGVTMVSARLSRGPVPAVLSTDTLFTLFTDRGLTGGGLHPDGDRFIFSVVVDGGEEGEVRPPRLILVQNFFTELLARVPNP